MQEEEFTETQFQELSGIHGLFASELPKYFFNPKYYDKTANHVHFDNKFVELKVVIDRRKRTLSITKYNSRVPNNRMFLRILESMAHYAVIYGFKKIKCVGKGDFHEFKHGKMCGYIALGKYGFRMTNLRHQDFIYKIRHHGSLANDIYELLQSEEGLKLWIRIGGKWGGTFFLSGPDSCLERLDDVIEKRKLGYLRTRRITK